MDRRHYAIEYAYSNRSANGGPAPDHILAFRNPHERRLWILLGNWLRIEKPGYREALPASHPSIRAWRKHTKEDTPCLP